MTERKSPFENPEPFGLPPGTQVRHQPGMAARFMRQISPLLAADGIDLDNLDDVDLDDLNAAMARAVERHNMELVTPFGDDLGRALNTLREIAQALHRDREAVAQQILGAIGSTPTAQRPSAGHLSGATLDTLDTWYADDAFKVALRSARLPAWDATTTAAAQDVQALAQKGRAFRSYERLVLKRGGFELARAGAFLVYAAVAAVANYQKRSFHQVLDEMLPLQQFSGGFAKGSAFGPAATQQTAAQQYNAQFLSWMRSDEDYEDVADEVFETFEGLVTDALQAGIDPHRAENFDSWLDFVHETTDIALVMVSLDAIHDYVHFRLATDQHPAPWEAAHTALMEFFPDGELDVPEVFSDIMATAQMVDESEREVVLNQLPVVSGLRALGDWLATSKPLTATGLPRRSDIATLAAMIGMDVQGVAKLPERGPWPEPGQLLGHGSTLYVQSAKDVDELMAWWDALILCDIITTMATRVKLGAAAHEYLGSDIVPLENAEILVAEYITRILTTNLGAIPQEADAIALTIKQLIATMSGGYNQRYVMDDDDEVVVMVMEMRTDHHFALLESAGILKVQDQEIQITPAMHIPLTLGAMGAFQEIALLLDVDINGTAW